MLIIGSSGSGKTNPLLNLINHKHDIDKIYTLKIHMKQNIGCQSTNAKVQAQKMSTTQI